MLFLSFKVHLRVLISASYARRWPLRSDSESLQTGYIERHQASYYSRDLRQTVIDPFSQLPLDDILDIVDLLSTREALLLSIASPAVSQKLDNSKFWKWCIAKDMPWIWDISLEDASSLTNWRRVYFDLQNMCTYNSHTRVLGLVNRKRIWNLCLPIAKGYLEQTLQKTEVTKREHESMAI